MTHSTPIAERVSRTNTWKLCGQGNPMMGMPSNSLEVRYIVLNNYKTRVIDTNSMARWSHDK